jgi:ubiquinol-cytochrome c reductase cytochrome c subunit
MTMLRFTAFLAAALLASPAAAAPAAPPKGDAVHGKAIFAAYGCYQCHGYQGQGGNAGSRLAPGPLPYAAVELQLREPRGRMPAYARKNLSDQDVADIYAYLLAIPKAKTVAEIPLLAGIAP